MVAAKCYIADRRPRLKTHFILRPRNAEFYYRYPLGRGPGRLSDADACELFFETVRCLFYWRIGPVATYPVTKGEKFPNIGAEKEDRLNDGICISS